MFFKEDAKMKCSNCNQEFDHAFDQCPYCGTENSNAVRILTPEEKMKYDGITIESETNHQEERAYGSQNTYRQDPRVYVKKINLGSSNWVSRVVVFAIIAAILSFLLFVALPVALVGIGIGVIVWTVLSFLKG